MFNTLKIAIASKKYDLPAISKKIDTLWLGGRLTDEERTQLQNEALANLSVENERPDMLIMLEELARRVAALEAIHAEDNTENTYPEWMPWNGLTTDYQPGAIVSHNGKLWKSVYSGQNVWEPGVIGTETLWVVYEEG